jgi:hypothetical protein
VGGVADFAKLLPQPVAMYLSTARLRPAFHASSRLNFTLRMAAWSASPRRLARDALNVPAYADRHLRPRSSADRIRGSTTPQRTRGP